MLRRAVKKWSTRRGESIAEALAAMLVIVLAGLMLAGAITSAARLNHAAAKVAAFPQYAGQRGDNGASVSVSGTLAGGVPVNTSIPVTMYEDEGEMYYYEKN